MSFFSRRETLLYLGLIGLVLGLGLRSLESLTLTPTATRILANIAGPADDSTRGSLRQAALGNGGVENGSVRRTLQPPRWLGWCVISLSVFFIAAAVCPRNAASGSAQV